jgi:hypothetical protein
MIPDLRTIARDAALRVKDDNQPGFIHEQIADAVANAVLDYLYQNTAVFVSLSEMGLFAKLRRQLDPSLSGVEGTRRQQEEEKDHNAALTAVDAECAIVHTPWRPIESAPKDGSWIVVGARLNGELWHVSSARYDGEYRKPWLNWDFDDPFYDAPTHWMPLPAPPKATP